MSGALFYLTDTTVAYVTADIQGQSGQWTTQTLPDGSRLILRGKSAVNLDFKTNQRVVELVQGQIYVDVAKDKTRPFWSKPVMGKFRHSAQLLVSVMTLRQPNSKCCTQR